MKINRGRAPAAIVAAVLVVAGCSSSNDDGRAEGETAPNIVQPGAPGEPARTLSAEEAEDLEPPRYTEDDVRFMQGMIHHHAQALLMTDLVEKRSKSRDIALLAKRIDITQEAEIEQMRTWLRARGQEAPALHRPHGHAHGIGARLMPGMLTRAEMNRLRRARGGAFDRLFLRAMIRHHEGAVTMVNRLYDSGSGVEPEIDAFARHVDADQQLEIARMRTVLRRLAAKR